MTRPPAFRYFLEVAKLGSIRRASQNLNVAASAISRQIILLEHEIGTPLLERLTRGVRLTDAGEILSRHLKESELNHELAIGWIQEIKGGRRGHVKVAAVEGLIGNFLPRVMRQLLNEYPQISVEILLHGAERVTDMLRNDECDIGLVIQPRDISNLAVGASLLTDFTAVMAPDHPLAERGNLTISDVSPHPVVLHAKTFSSRTLVDRAARRSGVTLNVVIETNSIEGMKYFAKAGLGIIFVPAFVVDRECKAGELVAVPMADREFRKLRLLVFTRRGRRLSPAGDRLLKMLVSGFHAADAP